ncbi:MAG: S8 family serine peptidase, partial [Flavobacteriales bacterium]|nr:S8 family serine peptidase [Flavobacteriales bacterium]
TWANTNTTIINAFESMANDTRDGLGAVVLVASGNENSSTIGPPCNYSSTLAVGSTTSVDLRSSFTNYGDDLTFVAPGSGIITTDMDGSEGYTNTGYVSFTGTSAACPVAAGVVGLMSSAYPELSREELTEALLTSCEKVGGYSYSTTPGNDFGTWNSEMGYGRVNAKLALDAAASFVNVCAGDFNVDGSIDAADLLVFLGDFGCQLDCGADMDGDGEVSGSDLLAFLAVFDTDC